MIRPWKRCLMKNTMNKKIRKPKKQLRERI